VLSGNLQNLCVALINVNVTIPLQRCQDHIHGRYNPKILVQSERDFFE
jgi:hypothetical protein